MPKSRLAQMPAPMPENVVSCVEREIEPRPGFAGPHAPVMPLSLDRRPARRPAPGNRTPIVRRQLSQEAGQALEILGHAIEYLADECALDAMQSGRLGSADPRIEAIQLLKGLNRAIYFEGPEVQPLFSRMWRWLLG